MKSLTSSRRPEIPLSFSREEITGMPSTHIEVERLPDPSVRSPWADPVSQQHSAASQPLMWMGLGILFLWAIWWGHSLQTERLKGGQYTWYHGFPSLGQESLRIIQASHSWQEGVNPYQETIDSSSKLPPCSPPLLLALFTWSSHLEPLLAVKIWGLMLTLLAIGGVVLSWRARKKQGLARVPLPLALGAVLLSTPMILSLDIGSPDLVIFALVVLTVAALSSRSILRDALAGIFLALATGLAIYPLFLGLGLIFLRRSRALAFFGLGLVSVVLLDPRGLLHFFKYQALWLRNNPLQVLSESSHSLRGSWHFLWENGKLHLLATVPGLVGALPLVLVPILWLSIQIYFSSNRKQLLYPYFLVLAAAATFLPRLSGDANLVFLPLAVLAIWDRRDPLVIHLLMALLLLWLQPFHLPIGPKLLLLFKFLGLSAMAFSLAHRARYQDLGAMEIAESRFKGFAPIAGEAA